MSAKYKSPSFLLPNELNTSANPANDTGINSLYSMDFGTANNNGIYCGPVPTMFIGDSSVSIWFKSEVANSNNVIFNRHSAGTGNFNDTYVIRTELSGSGVKIKLELGNPLKSFYSQNVYSKSVWHHLAVTLSYSGGQYTVKFYVDGVEDSPTNSPMTMPTMSSTTLPLTIGAQRSGSNFIQGCRGELDEVAIFNKALTDGTGGTVNQISSLYNSGSPASAATTINLGAIAYYPLGEQAQNSGYLSASGNEWQFPNGVLQDYVMDFSGLTTNFEHINVDVNLGNTFTISGWFNIDAFGAVVLQQSGSPETYALYFRNSTEIRTRFNGSNNVAFTGLTLNTNQWTNFIIVRSGDSQTLYINGSSAGTLSGAGTSDFTLQKIGGYSWDGRISNVAAWNTAITDANQIANIYNNGSPQTTYTVTPQNWWKLNSTSVYTPSAPNYTTALNFNSTKSDIDYVQFGNTSLSLPASLSLWLKPLGVPPNGYGMPYSDSSGQIYWATSSGGMRYEVTLAGASQLNSTVTLTADIGGWQHLVITFTSTDTKIYLNGELNVSGSGGTGTNFGQDINIGRWKQYGTNTIYSFDGSISNFAIFNSELSASQVSTLFNFGTPETNISLSPIHNWKLDNLTTGLNDTGSLASNNGTAGSVNGTGPVQESTSVAVVPSWKIPSALPIPTINYTKSLSFNGSSNYIDLPSQSTLEPSSNYTFSIWFNSTGNQYSSLIGTSVGISKGITLLYASSVLKWYHVESDGSNNAFQISLSSVNTGDWANVTVTWDSASGNIRAFVNKVYVNGASNVSDIDWGNSFLKLGFYSPNNWYYSGKLSNSVIWNTTLTDGFSGNPTAGSVAGGQVAEVYNSGQPQASITGSPVGWWKLDDQNTITDYSGNNYTGTNNGALDAPGDVTTSDFNIPVNGVSTTLPSTALQQSDLQFDSPYSNYSLYFDGASSRVQALYNLPSGVTKFSVSIWGNVEGAGSSVNKCLISNENSNSADGYALFTEGTYPNTKVSFKIENNTSTQTTSNIVFGEWFHVLATYDNGTAKIYFNGVLEDTTTGVPAINTSSLVSTMIGSYRESNPIIPMLGHLDEAAIWETVALTDAQVLQTYNNGKPNDISSLSPTNWWRLGENAYFNNGNKIVTPNSIIGGVNGIGSGTVNDSLSANAPGTYANGIGTNLDILDRVGDAPLSVANSQSYNMIPDDKVPYVPGYVGNQIANNFSMSFDGNNKIIVSNSSTLNFSGNISFSMWLKYTNTTSYLLFCLFKDAAIGKQYSIDLRPHGSGQRKIQLETTANGVTTARSTQTLAIPQNIWTHLSITIDSGVVDGTKFYVNGTPETSSFAHTIESNETNLIIGGNNTSNFEFIGSIDELAIFDKALTADQVKFDLYQPSLPLGNNKTADIANNPNLPNPVAWYRMGD